MTENDKFIMNQIAVKLVKHELEGFITGLQRVHDNPTVAHIYRGTFSEPAEGMCKRAPNSIFRNNFGEGGFMGICMVCLKKVMKEKKEKHPLIKVVQ